MELYDPCGAGSRLGVTQAVLDAAVAADPSALDGLTGLHFHNLCELGADALARTLRAVESRFAPYLSKAQWVNFGGGHHITRGDYDTDLLVAQIKAFRTQWNVNVYLETGEAIGLNTGVLLASVLDIVPNGDIQNAILDVSATAHMPDVLEMPYRPQIVGAQDPQRDAKDNVNTPHPSRLGGLSCLAGDVIGDYSFGAPLAIGDQLVFLDMAHYTMVKTTNFRGPAARHWPVRRHKNYRVIKKFG